MEEPFYKKFLTVLETNMSKFRFIVNHFRIHNHNQVGQYRDPCFGASSLLSDLLSPRKLKQDLAAAGFCHCRIGFKCQQQKLAKKWTKHLNAHYILTPCLNQF